MNPIFRLTAALLLFVSALTSQAYERPTHRALSNAAFQSSILQTDPGILSSHGLKASDTFRNSENDERTILGLIEDGSDFEDNFPRSLNHFYDPINDKGLLGVNPKSPDWALEDQGSHTSQDNSYNDARGYLYDALAKAGSTRAERDADWGKLFQSLGQIIHHIQDMAQPQHTRNDSHGGFGLGPKSLYEIYTKEHPDSPAFANALAQPYGPVTFDTARKFWITGDGRGLAEFSSYNFLSAGTNFIEHPDGSIGTRVYDFSRSQV